MVQGTIITSYCLQGQLLISHLTFLRAKLLQHTQPALDWMKVKTTFPQSVVLFYFIYLILTLSFIAVGLEKKKLSIWRLDATSFLD